MIKYLLEHKWTWLMFLFSSP